MPERFSTSARYIDAARLSLSARLGTPVAHTKVAARFIKAIKRQILAFAKSLLARVDVVALDMVDLALRKATPSLARPARGLT